MATAPATPAQTAPIVTESELTYQPPAQPPAEEYEAFNAALKDSISEISNEYAPGPEDDEAPADDLDHDKGPDNVETKSEPEPEGTEDAPEDKESPEIAKGVQRLVQREVALQAKEQAFQARESRAAQLEQENAKLRAQVPAQAIQEQMATSPTEAIKALGHDPETVVRLMIAEQLKAAGKPVPPELQKFIEKSETDRKIKTLEAKIKENEAATQTAAYVNAIAAGGREYVKTVPEKAFPELAKLTKTNPDRAHREIMEEITADAQRRMAADPNGQPLTYPEAAKRVEARLNDWKAIFTPASGPATNGSPTTPATGKPATPPVTKAPAKPLKPWGKKGDDLLSSALKDAEREFYRVEAKDKRR